MSDYESLRRGNYHPDAAQQAARQEAEELGRESYHPDATGQAARQEADELGRGSFHPDALAKAAEQEAYERDEVDETSASAPSSKPAADAPGPHASDRDIADHTVMRRTTTPEQNAASGGAVISRRSNLGLKLRRRVRDEASDARAQERKAARERRRWEREQRKYERGGGGAGRVLLGLLVAVVALYLVFCLPIDRAISFTREESQGLSKELSWHVPGMPYYVLALGSDAREGEDVSRTDTMILARIDLIGGKITMLSIPRDTKVEIEGYGTQKINAAYAHGGVAGAVRAVHELTGVPISHAAVVRFDGVESLVDYLGGVTVNVPVAVNDPYYTGLVLPAGEQEMDGHTALLFSRVRHGFDLGDYQRQKDQRILIEALMHKVLDLPPWQMPGVVSHMGGMVGTSMRMYNILPLMVHLKLGGATIYQATVPSTTAMIDGVSYVIADEAALAQMMDVIDKGGDPATLM